ncbi:MAG TPA: hypothetical protein PLR85_18190, partial [Nitrospira sp.]|nr:hypothetical protein [Nitrospira sp.]
MLTIARPLLVVRHCSTTSCNTEREFPLDEGLNCCDPTAMVERLIGTPGISEPTNDPSHPSFGVSALAPP